MATSSTAGGAAPPPPSEAAIFFTYSVLGAILAFAFGRDPASGALLPPTADALVHEVAPTAMVICLFLVSYSLLDVLAVGVAKGKHGYLSKPYTVLLAMPTPEEVFIAQRVQTNQVEQLPGFLVASVSFAVFVNGTVGAVLSLVWATLRRAYASAYRTSIGQSIGRAGVSNYTIPAYFIVNSMLMATVFQCARIVLVGVGK